ncbi:hypothetical protein BGLT_02204 [Caballeronia glathei]|uniref:Uncharacterized protein n=1 Tax=Caballeronia glathei TaxID=60547 RepID=A0A069PLP6_9BURK|nr:hypothetical protein [Caballeronia glathei]KDR41608.1 hypothetical protein BG61_17025 [Caballeronia glathei]CDY79423.1 hypothetical protein BGLT_02204 [Caballeronia glathei]
MNGRIYKKQAKRAIELLRSHGTSGWTEADLDDDVRTCPRKEHPNNVDIKGSPVFGYMSGYYEPEWTEECPRSIWIDVHYWAFIVPENFGGDPDEVEPMTRDQRWQRMSTKAIAPGWRWRGKRAVKATAD